MRISDWSSDVCSSDLHSRIARAAEVTEAHAHIGNLYVNRAMIGAVVGSQPFGGERLSGTGPKAGGPHYLFRFVAERAVSIDTTRSEEHTSELQSLMRISYAVFCLKKKKNRNEHEKL